MHFGAVRLQIQGFRFKVQGSRFRLSGLGLGVQGAGLRVQAVGLRVQGSRVYKLWAQATCSCSGMCELAWAVGQPLAATVTVPSTKSVPCSREPSEPNPLQSSKITLE